MISGYMSVSVTFYIFLHAGEKDRSYNLHQREGHAILVSGCPILTVVN